MQNERLSLAGEEQAGFRKNFLRVLVAHVVLVLLAWTGGRLFFKSRAPEPITWLDGGGETGSALALPENPDPSPASTTSKPEAEILPPLPPPPDPLHVPKDFEDLAMLPKPTPTPTPKPKPTATPAPKPKSTTPTPTPSTKPKPKPTATPKNSTTGKSAKPTPSKNVAKLATPRPGTKVVAPKITDAGAKPQAEGTGKENAPAGTGDSTNAGTKGGPGAAGGSNSVLLGYFKKVEQHFHREWKPPQTVVSSSREVEAHVRLRVAADGTVELIDLVKPTGNVEVDKSIEEALQRVKKIESPPVELLKNGVLEASVEFILEV